MRCTSDCGFITKPGNGKARLSEVEESSGSTGIILGGKLQLPGGFWIECLFFFLKEPSLKLRLNRLLFGVWGDLDGFRLTGLLFLAAGLKLPLFGPSITTDEPTWSESVGCNCWWSDRSVFSSSFTSSNTSKKPRFQSHFVKAQIGFKMAAVPTRLNFCKAVKHGFFSTIADNYAHNATIRINWCIDIVSNSAWKF